MQALIHMESPPPPRLPSPPLPAQVAEAVVAAVKEGKEEEVVGAAFQALLTTYRLTGFNPASLAP